MDQQYKSILINITTRSDIEQILSCIDLLLESFYSAKGTDYKKIIDKSLSLDFANILKKAFDTFAYPSKPLAPRNFSETGWQSGDTFDTSKIKDFLTTLKEKISNFKTIKLTIAFSPTSDCIKTISAFIKEQFGEDFIIDLEEDPKILGGAIIDYNGKYQNLSLKKSLDETFEKRKKEIIEIVK